MWDSVLGHEQNKEFLQRFLQAQARPHALLFSGAEGLGKRKLALEFAKTFLCLNGKGGDGCEACRLLNFADGNVSHPDFILLEPEENSKNIKIEQVKELIKQAAFAPVMSARKICIVDYADKMTVEAANSFLKLLEEPPEGWLIILLAATDEKLLPTILSRVVRLRFNPVSTEQVQKALEAQGIGGEESKVLARVSDGSVGAAVRLHEQDALAYRQTALALAEAFPLTMPMNYLAGCAWLEKYKSGDALLFVKLLQLIFRDMLFIKINLTDSLYNCDIRENLTALAADWKLAGLKKALMATEETYKALESSVGVKLALESMALKIDKFQKE